MASEESLIDDCINGDVSAQSRLYKKHSPIMLSICIRYSRSREEAEDILQEGFIKVFTHLHTFRKEGSLEGWIKRIMVNTALNYYHKTKKQAYHNNIEDIRETDILDQEIPEPEVKFTQKELLDCIQQLPEGYKLIFNLYVFEKYKHREIAEMLKISTNTSKSQLSKARSFLIKLVNELEKQKRRNL